VTCGAGVLIAVVFVLGSPPHAMDKITKDSVRAMTESERRGDNNVNSLLFGGVSDTGSRVPIYLKRKQETGEPKRLKRQ
jgi:hypothetical protein